jgi:uncharacterized membrane protein YfcA
VGSARAAERFGGGNGKLREIPARDAGPVSANTGTIDSTTMFDLSIAGLIVLYLAVGAIAGMNTGFLGGGGGVITVPILIYVFTLLGYPENASVHTAVGTSLFVIIFNAATSSLVHLKKGVIHHRILAVMIMAGVLGAAAGGLTSAMTASPLFKKLLGVFLLVTAVRFLQASRRDSKDEGLLNQETAPECPVNERRYPPRTFVLSGLIGFFSGFVASFFGIGGGAITIPLGIILVRFTMIEAICYSTCLMAACTTVGVAVLMIAGMNAPEHVPHSIGYVNYVAGLTMVVSGTYTAKWAAAKVHTINQRVLMRIVTVVIVIAAVGLFIK